jgi:hypothetical protein
MQRSKTLPVKNTIRDFIAFRSIAKTIPGMNLNLYVF